MSRKVFLSVLGTGFYGECRYAKGDFVSSPTRFVQTAMLEYFGANEWTDGSVAYILLTDRAMTTNWKTPSNKRLNAKTDMEEPYVGLKNRLSGYPIVEPISIPEGKDEAEIWTLFEIVFDRLCDGDELYFDITHGFRYLPMFILVLANYAKFLKGVKVKAICYGNYEGRNEQGIAPIVDLLPLSALQDWTFAAANFIENGNMDRLRNMSKAELKTLAKPVNGVFNMENKETADTFNYFINALSTFVSDMKFCRGVPLFQSEAFSRVKDYSAQYKKGVIKPLQPVLDRIVASTSDFVAEESALNCLAAAKWCYEKGYYQPAITELQEGIVTFLCVRHDIPITDKDKRQAVNQAFEKQRRANQGKTFEYERRGALDTEDLVNEISADELLKNKELVSCFGELSNIRNDFNHSGMRPDAMSPKQLEQSIKKCIDKTFTILYGNKYFPL